MRRRTFVRRAALGAGVPALPAILAACSRAGTAQSREPSGLPAQPVELHFPMPNDPPTEAYAKAVNDRLRDRFSGRLTLIHDPWLGTWQERYEKWTAMSVSGDVPDVIWLCCEFVRPFFSAGHIQELESFIKRDWKAGQVDDYYKGMWEGMRLDGKQFAIPVYVNTTTMYYNRGALVEAGLPPPPEDWSFERFLEYATKLNRPDLERWGYMMSFASLNRTISFIWAWGGEVHDPTDGPVVTRLTYDDARTIEALQYLHDLIWKHRVSPATDAQRGGLDLISGFRTGKSALYYAGSNETGGFQRDAATSGLDWDVTALVRGPRGYGVRMGNDGYMIPKAGKHVEAAWTLVKELSTLELQTVRVQTTGARPPTRSAQPVWEQAYPGRNLQKLRTMADQARPDPQAYWKDSAAVSAMIQNHLRAAMERNEITVGDAVRRAMQEVRAYYGTR